MAVTAISNEVNDINYIPPVIRSKECGALSFTTSAVQGVQVPSETILEEAQRLTHGDRQLSYSHPLDDYTRTAALVNAALAHKLRVNLDPEDVTIIMALVKISRQMHKPKRDNMTDLAGYAWCTYEIGEERERRSYAMHKAATASQEPQLSLIDRLRIHDEKIAAQQKYQKQQEPTK